MVVYRFGQDEDMSIHGTTRDFKEGDWMVVFTHGVDGEIDDRELLVTLFKVALNAYPDSTEVFDWLMKLHADLGIGGTEQ